MHSCAAFIQNGLGLLAPLFPIDCVCGQLQCCCPRCAVHRRHGVRARRRRAVVGREGGACGGRHRPGRWRAPGDFPSCHSCRCQQTRRRCIKRDAHRARAIDSICGPRMARKRSAPGGLGPSSIWVDGTRISMSCKARCAVPPSVGTSARGAGSQCRYTCVQTARGGQAAVLVSAGADGIVCVWSAERGTLLQKIDTTPHHRRAVRCTGYTWLATLHHAFDKVSAEISEDE